MSLVSERYADAFFQAAEAHGQVDACLKDILDLKELFLSEPKLVSVLVTPKTTQAEKKTLIEDVFRGNVEDYTFNLLRVLLDKGRITEVPAIADDYQKFYHERHNVISMTITTAFEAEPELIEKISEKFRKQYDADAVKVETKVDPDLIGGAIIVIGDTMYDESVRGKLAALQAEINAE
ncbi:MAG: F0F1 ATP synthase subunit delta [Clostridia bacterium]|nr:F0F1 ATP synthase subunit delta [Clostridia bacterium]MBQ8470111.1 F0F1 ATP synthase subunit delta [Clostridia bacterium]MBR1704379.1 F0F1 ATP synthase subunit delta [Clostridia bacterium]